MHSGNIRDKISLSAYKKIRSRTVGIAKTLASLPLPLDWSSSR